MTNLTILRGLQGCGKSSKAEALVKTSKGRTKRVERDCLRQMLDFGEFSPKNEKTVTRVQEAIIALLLDEGFDVVSSDTNLNPKTHERLRRLGLDRGASVSTDNTLMGVPVEECIKRDLQRPRSVGERVIRQTYHRYRALFGIDESDIYNDPSLPAAIVVDMDGTLADISHRNPYDTAKCLDDTLRCEVYDMLFGLWRNDDPISFDKPHIFIFSGREEKYRDLTKQWLEKIHFNLPYSLHMRPTGEFVADEVVKRNLAEQYIRGTYRVLAWIDDRPRVIRMARDLGIKVADVGAGVEF